MPKPKKKMKLSDLRDKITKVLEKRLSRVPEELRPELVNPKSALFRLKGEEKP